MSAPTTHTIALRLVHVLMLWADSSAIVWRVMLLDPTESVKVGIGCVVLLGYVQRVGQLSSWQPVTMETRLWGIFPM